MPTDIFMKMFDEPQEVKELLQFAWDSFYADESQTIKMFKLFQQVVRKEMAENTLQPRDRSLAKAVFGKPRDSGTS